MGGMVFRHIASVDFELILLTWKLLIVPEAHLPLGEFEHKV